MDAYIYQAALLCGPCGWKKCIDLTVMHEQHNTGDSDDFPQGPYEDGGGEADCLQHCDHCQVFLENPLTSRGYRYVIEQLCRPDFEGSLVSDLWSNFYGINTEPYQWDRFDICEAWYLALYACHGGQGSDVYARASSWHRRVRFNPHPSLSVETLSENGLAIYIQACRKLLSKG